MVAAPLERQTQLQRSCLVYFSVLESGHFQSCYFLSLNLTTLWLLLPLWLELLELCLLYSSNLASNFDLEVLWTVWGLFFEATGLNLIKLIIGSLNSLHTSVTPEIFTCFIPWEFRDFSRGETELFIIGLEENIILCVRVILAR